MKFLAILSLALLQASSTANLDPVRLAFQGRQYDQVIKLAGQMLPSIAKTGTAADKAELLEMKGESHLQLHQWPQASDAYTQAGTASTDEKTAAIDRATAVLIKRSTGGKYSAKLPSTNPATAGNKGPFDILDSTQRKDAFEALYNDDSRQVLNRITALQKATGLTALMQGLKQVADLRYLELAATGGDSNYQSAISGIVDHANTLMTDALKKMETQVDTISKNANASSEQMTPGENVGSVIISTKRGLSSTDRNQLNEVINTSNSIAQASDEFGKAAGKASALDATKSSANTLAKKATEVLNADYSTPVGSMGNQPTVIHNPGAAGGARPGR